MDKRTFIEEVVHYIASKEHSVFLEAVDSVSKNFLNTYSKEAVIDAIEFFKAFGIETDGSQLFIKNKI